MSYRRLQPQQLAEYSDGHLCLLHGRNPHGPADSHRGLAKPGQSDYIEIVGIFLDPFLNPAGPIKSHSAQCVHQRQSVVRFAIRRRPAGVRYQRTPPAPVLVAHYDTHPENTQYNTYYGNWGNYPWLPSGTIIAGDMQNGLQLLKLSVPTATNQPALSEQFVIPRPNPAT